MDGITLDRAALHAAVVAIQQSADAGTGLAVLAALLRPEARAPVVRESFVEIAPLAPARLAGASLREAERSWAAGSATIEARADAEGEQRAEPETAAPQPEWRNYARELTLRGIWMLGFTPDQLYIQLHELPGPKIPAPVDISIWAAELGLPARWSPPPPPAAPLPEAAPPAPAAGAVEAPTRSAQQRAWTPERRAAQAERGRALMAVKDRGAVLFGPERLEKLRELWPAGTDPDEVLAMLQALPGPKLTSVGQIRDFAARSGIRRPRAEPVHPRRSEARDTLLIKLWPTDTANPEIMRQLNALPGETIPNITWLYTVAPKLGLPTRRPAFEARHAAMAEFEARQAAAPAVEAPSADATEPEEAAEVSTEAPPKAIEESPASTAEAEVETATPAEPEPTPEALPEEPEPEPEAMPPPPPPPPREPVKPPTDDDIEREAKDLLAAGLPAREVAAEMGLPMSLVGAWAFALREARQAGRRP